LSIGIVLSVAHAAARDITPVRPAAVVEQAVNSAMDDIKYANDAQRRSCSRAHSRNV